MLSETLTQKSDELVRNGFGSLPLGRAAMVGYFFAYVIDAAGGAGLVDLHQSFLGKTAGAYSTLVHGRARLEQLQDTFMS